MSPHNALMIPEIITEIVANLKLEVNDIRDPDRRKDLLSAALCCEAFKNPGLDVLWHTMDSIVPVLKLIPGMQRVQDQMVLSFYLHLSEPFLTSCVMQVLSGDLDTNNLKVFYSYARRVRRCIMSVFFPVERATCAQLLRLEHGVLPLLTVLKLPDGLRLSSYGNYLPVLLPPLVRSQSLSSVTGRFICWDDPDNDYPNPLGRFLLPMLVKNVNLNIQVLHHLHLWGTLQRQYISCLSHFTHLRSISLRWLGSSSLSLEFTQPWYRISDEEISELVLACPSLKILSIHHSQGQVIDVDQWPT